MFSHIAITAANAAQAKGYRAQTARRKDVSVFADPGGRRVGSLGATVNALRRILARPSRPRTLLVCHSGGDARRTPGYAALGKAFIPLADSRPLLEHIEEAMSALPLPRKGGVLVVSGDVLPEFDPSGTDFSRPGVTGVAYPGPASEARRHGVYVVKGRSAGLHAVDAFLQKPDVRSGTHLIDTGILFIDWPTAAKMASLPVAGDIYEEFPAMLLGGYAPFSVNVVSPCRFFHVGSTRELLEKLGSDGRYVDAAHCPLHLAGDNVVTNIPPGRFKSLSLAKGECFTCIPYGKDSWLDLKYNIDDNFKTDGLWEKHGLGEIAKQVDYRRLLPLRSGKRPAVRVTAPVRIDFAGGWSDTPPICDDNGGCVLNAAVRLEGAKPVEVLVRERADKLVRVVSKDLGKRRFLRSQAEIDCHDDPSDWCALVKCALAVTGFRFGSRGLDISICANLPKGSGMGTSSILGAATVAALAMDGDPDFLCAKTLELEREMRTGGGWQDQCGGIAGGVKLVTSKPGTPQAVKISHPAGQEWFASLLAERGLLYFTGQKRMARNILRKVLSFYSENPHGFASILVKSLKSGARAAAAAIARRDADAFAKAIAGYWRDKKLLDPGSTNARVEEIAERVGPYLSAYTLTGAGGGGFMFMLAKSAADAKAAKQELSRNPPSTHSRFYGFSIDNDGLQMDFSWD